tara:strand:+ start:32911 stop:33624 length:714 start_codon:yes stop_codon:yes gene_type:complete
VGKYYLLFVVFLCPTLFAIQDGFYGGVNLFAGSGKTSVKDLNVDNDPGAGTPTESHQNKLSKTSLSPGIFLSYLIRSPKITVAPELYINWLRNQKSGRFLSHRANHIFLNVKEKNKGSGGVNIKTGHFLQESDVFLFGLIGFGIDYKKIEANIEIDNGDSGPKSRKTVKDFSAVVGLGADYFVTEKSFLNFRVEYRHYPSSHKIVQSVNDGLLEHTSYATFRSKGSLGASIGFGFKF